MMIHTSEEMQMYLFHRDYPEVPEFSDIAFIAVNALFHSS